MTTPRIWIPFVLAMTLVACGDDGSPAESDTESGTDTDTGTGTTDSTTAPTTSPTTTPTTDATTTSPTTDPSDTDATSTGTGTTDGPTTGVDTGTSGTEGTTGTGTGTGTTGGAGSDYEACEFQNGQPPTCPREYDLCINFGPNNMCSFDCTDDEDCPPASSGNAVPVCGGPNDDRCELDCTNGEDCPDGMDCVPIGNQQFSRCFWTN